MCFNWWYEVLKEEILNIPEEVLGVKEQMEQYNVSVYYGVPMSVFFICFFSF